MEPGRTDQRRHRKLGISHERNPGRAIQTRHLQRPIAGGRADVEVGHLQRPIAGGRADVEVGHLQRPIAGGHPHIQTRYILGVGAQSNIRTAEFPALRADLVAHTQAQR
jgi:hypothetical protein